MHTCNNIHTNFVHYNYTLFLIRLLLGNGYTFRRDSVIDARFLPLQFPFVTFVQREFTTLSAWVFLQNSFTLGLSLDLPLCLWHPKYCSKGYGLIISLKNDFTSGKVNKYFISSINKVTVKVRTHIYVCMFTSDFNPQTCLRTQKHALFLFVRVDLTDLFHCSR